MLKLRSRPSTAFFETFISDNNNGISMGKLRIAIKLKLLLVLEAIADTMLKTLAKPMLPKTKVSIKKGISSTRFLIKSEYTKKHTKLNSSISNEL